MSRFPKNMYPIIKRLFIPDGDLVAYVQNRYVATGKTLGTYGFSVKKE